MISVLTKKTVKDAIKGANVETRLIATQKLGRTIREAALTPADRDFSEKLLTLICKDVSEVVRRALAITLQNSPNLPRKIAQLLIQDIDSIAIPILKNSPVLTDEDLAQILKSKAAEKVKAIAQRQQLSAHISSAIISYGDSAAIAQVAANDSAMISPETASAMADIYADDDLIREAALSRYDMPPKVVQKLINASACQIENKLEASGAMSAWDAADIANRTQQRALLSYVDKDWPERNLISYVTELNGRGQLTSDLLLRAAGIGDMRFVQIALAKLNGVSVRKAGLMLFDGGPLGLRALSHRAGFSTETMTFLKAALAIYRDFQLSGNALTNKQTQKVMIERILTLPFDLSPALEAEFSEKLDSLSHVSLVVSP